MTVRHRTRDLGTGEALDVYRGTPERIWRVRWTVLATNGQRLWGDYPESELVKETG